MGKDCNCKGTRSVSESRVFATCANCTEPLMGLNGKRYLINVGPVYVTRAQIEAWKEQGYDIIIN